MTKSNDCPARLVVKPGAAGRGAIAIWSADESYACRIVKRPPLEGFAYVRADLYDQVDESCVKLMRLNSNLSAENSALQDEYEELATEFAEQQEKLKINSKQVVELATERDKARRELATLKTTQDSPFSVSTSIEAEYHFIAKSVYDKLAGNYKELYEAHEALKFKLESYKCCLARYVRSPGV